jgi:hypothetical protein
MGLGIAAIAVSIICLVASLGFGAPGWVNIVGVATGIAGLVLLGRAKRGGGG